MSSTSSPFKTCLAELSVLAPSQLDQVAAIGDVLLKLVNPEFAFLAL